MQELKIPMAKAILLRKEIPFDELKVMSSVGLPCFVKPNNGGSSCGTSKVNEANQFKEAMKIAFDEDNEVIVEEFIKGREVSCGVLKTKEKAILMPITEIVSKKEFFDYEAKYTPGMSEEITPARLSPEEVKLCHKHCSDIYDFFGCSGIVRIDFILRDDVFYFLEINTVPGMSEASIVPQQSAVYGISMKDLLTLVIRDRMPV
jgi:D-alanine-D-alanine ligase